MNKNLIIIGIIIVILIGIILYNKSKLEHLTITSDEAIQNIASLYNKDELTIGKMTILDKLVVKDLVASTFNFLPKGMITAWSGDVAPDGWALCDGTNGTPNLKDRFILGGPPYGQTGGAWSYQLSVGMLPNHTHQLAIEPTGGWNGSTPQGSDRGERTSNNTGNCNGCASQPYPITPPFYRLAYIIKL